MTDLTKVPDDVLLQLYQQRQTRDLSKLSDTELLGLYNERRAKAAPVDSGDELVARRAGDTRAQMRPEDISTAYDFAQARAREAQGRLDQPKGASDLIAPGRRTEDQAAYDAARAEQKKMAEAYVTRERADSPTYLAIDDRARAIARGVPLIGSSSDEVNSFLNSPLSAMGLSDKGQSYEKALDYQRARNRGFDELAPWTSAGYQLAGGIGSGLAAGPAIGSLMNLPRMGAVAGGAAAGAGIGGADAFLNAEGGFGERAAAVPAGAAIGGALGTLAPVVGNAVRGVTQKVTDYMAQTKALQQLGMSRPATDAVLRAMESDLTPQGAARIQAAGANGMLADAGPTASGLLDATIQRGGAGATTARNAIEARAGQAGQDIQSALDTSLGAPRGVEASIEATRRATASARSTAYRDAYAQPIDYAHPVGQEVEGLLSRLPGEAIGEANRLMKVRGEKSKQILASVDPEGNISYKVMPDVRQLDYITRALNEVADQSDGAGKLGGQTAYGSALRDLAGEIRDRVRTLVPEYDKALQTAAEPIALVKALRIGEDFLSPSVAKDEAVRSVARMTQPERDALKQGVRSTIDEKLANVRRVATDPNVDARQGLDAIKMLSSDANRYKLQVLLGKSEADKLFRQIDGFATAFELRAAVATNSRTAGRLAVKDVVDQYSEPGILGTLMEGRPIQALRRVLQEVIGTGPQYRQRLQDMTYDQIAQVLTKPRGAQAVQILRDLQRAARLRSQGTQIGTTLGGAIAGAGAGGAYRGAMQYLDSQK